MSATVNGQRATSLRVFVPHTGPWFADIEMDGARGLTGRVTATYGALSLVGTVDPRADGSRSDQQITRIIGGAGGWGRPVVPKYYANDAGVKALVVAQDAAREAGETLGTFLPTIPIIGRAYTREVGPASRALEDAIGATPWWVGYDGVTNVGPRASTTAVSGTYEIIEYKPRDRVAEIALDDMTAVGIGSVLTDRLDAPQTVRGIEIVITENTARMYAWCGLSGRDRMAALLEDIIEHVVARRLYGKFRYRVVSMDVDRVKLQVVNARTGLPNALPVSMAPGAAGVHAQLTPGAEVFVEFEEGDRTKPLITGFAGKDGVGFVPMRVEIANDSDTPAPAAARVGDAIKVTFPVNSFLTSAQTPVYNSVPLEFTGVITEGSSKVGIG